MCVGVDVDCGWMHMCVCVYGCVYVCVCVCLCECKVWIVGGCGLQLYVCVSVSGVWM